MRHGFPQTAAPERAEYDRASRSIELIPQRPLKECPVEPAMSRAAVEGVFDVFELRSSEFPVKSVFDIAALPICDIVSAPTRTDSDSRTLGWLAADSRIHRVARDVAAIGRRKSLPGSRMLSIQDRNRIAGHGRPESRLVSKVA
jgi:hypothetical protein